MKNKIIYVVILLSILLVAIVVTLCFNKSNSEYGSKTNLQTENLNIEIPQQNSASEITFNKQEEGPPVEVFQTSAWLNYSASEFYTDSSISWRTDGYEYIGEIVTPDYLVDIHYVSDNNECVIFVFNPEDYNETFAQFE